MRYTIKSLLFFVCLIFYSATHAGPPEHYPFVDYTAGLAAAKKSGKKIFLYFGRFGCAFCAKTDIETFSDKDLRKLYIDHYELIYVDAESGKRIRLSDGERITELELGTRLKVFATPMFVYLEPDGNVIFKAPGYKTVQEFMEFDDYIQGGHYKTKSINDYLKK